MKEFVANGCNLIVGCNSTQKLILRPEFPSSVFVDLQGYDVSYGNEKWSTKFRLLWQTGKILTKINHENRWLRGFLKENRVDAIVSDNRYGLASTLIPSVFITHQLAPKTNFGRLADAISRKFIYNRIRRFTECWVPDDEGKVNLAGQLSHPTILPRTKVTYIGPLSRFSVCDSIDHASDETKLLILLSGPEPQRSQFENILIPQLQSTTFSSVFVRGVPAETAIPPQLAAMEHVTFYNHLDTASLNKAICESTLVISRSGYTTVMDLLKLKKKMILVPTPGQPEQEYLGHWLGSHQLALCLDQKSFSIQKAIKGATTYPFKQIDREMNEYKLTVKQFVERISS